MSDIIHTCGCGRTFDVAQWRALTSAGRMDDGEGGSLDLRNCPCGSTRAVDVAALDEDDRILFELKRAERVIRLVEAAARALDLARAYAAEDRAAGVDVAGDPRIADAIRQADEYTRAIARQRAMTFNCEDTALVAPRAKCPRHSVDALVVSCRDCCHAWNYTPERRTG